MTERARTGVQVNVIADAIGNFSLQKGYFDELTKAGGQIEWYHPIRWNTWPRINNRTHRELLIVDGNHGFIGGAGFADHWYKNTGDPQWRDTMVRVEGEAVAGLQAVFAENWLEGSGEVLAGYGYFPFQQAPTKTTSIVVASTPTTGGSTSARVLFQTLIASAEKNIHITTPYFLPDNSARAELIRAIKERGVKVNIVVPGHHNDHLLTRRSSRRLYGDLLEAGARIYEYSPSMIHTKSMTVDGLWGVVGSTNFDGRSFAINDEANLAVLDAAFATRLDEDFTRDLANSREITYEQWKRRPQIERAHELFGWLLERQQ
jgi:cardiolipin synthase